MSRRNEINLGPNQEIQAFSKLLGTQMSFNAMIGLKSYGLTDTHPQHPFFF